MTHRVGVAKVVLLNEKGQLLSLRRSDTHPTRAHHIDLPGGIVDPGETEHEAAIRELQEEASIHLDPNDCVLFHAETHMYEPKDSSVTRIMYFAKFDHTPEVVISWEHESYEWMAIEKFIEIEEDNFYSIPLLYAVKHGLFNS